MTHIDESYDLKRILLSEFSYDDSKPIMNILKAYKRTLYKDTYSDYVVMRSKGDVEYYKCVQEIFGTVYGCSENVPKDIMNSFWYTYKFALQFYYPEYFRPNELKDCILTTPTLKNMKDISMKFPPYKEDTPIDLKYETYYQNLKAHLKDFKSGTNWIDFLIANYDKFEKVHENELFKTFARLTHTIGNIAIVPRGLNTSRGRYAFDYWDYTLLSLKDSFSTLNGELWEIYINSYHLNFYVDTNYEVLPLWPTHFSNTGYKPQLEEEFNTFLTTVNSHIFKRGQEIMHIYHQLKQKKEP